MAPLPDGKARRRFWIGTATFLAASLIVYAWSALSGRARKPSFEVLKSQILLLEDSLTPGTDGNCTFNPSRQSLTCEIAGSGTEKLITRGEAESYPNPKAIRPDSISAGLQQLEPSIAASVNGGSGLDLRLRFKPVSGFTLVSAVLYRRTLVDQIFDSKSDLRPHTAIYDPYSGKWFLSGPKGLCARPLVHVP